MQSITNRLPRWVTDQWRIFQSVIIPLAVITMVVLMLMVTMVVGIQYLNGVSCQERGRAMQIDVQWGFWTGCMVNIRGQLLPASEVVPIEQGGRIIFKPKPHVRLTPAETDK